MQFAATRGKSARREEFPRTTLRISPVLVVDREVLSGRAEDGVQAFLSEFLKHARAAEQSIKTHPASMVSRQPLVIGNAQPLLCADLWQEMEARDGEASGVFGPIDAVLSLQGRLKRQLNLLLEDSLGIVRRIREVAPKIASRFSWLHHCRSLGKQERVATWIR